MGGSRLAWGSVCVGGPTWNGVLPVGVPPGMGFYMCLVPPGMGFYMCVLGSTCVRPALTVIMFIRGSVWLAWDIGLVN